LDGLAAGEELRLGDHVAAAARITALAAALPLGLQAGRPLDGLDLVPRLADLDHGVRRIVRRAGGVVAAAGAAPPPTPPRAGGGGGGGAAGGRTLAPPRPRRLALQAGRPLDGVDPVPRLADLAHGVRRIVRRAGVVVAAAGAAPPPTPPRAGGAGGGVAAGVRAVPARAGLGIV